MVDELAILNIAKNDKDSTIDKELSSFREPIFVNRQDQQKQVTFAEALDIVCKELSEDPELYYAYQANIAMAFFDEYNSKKARKAYLNRTDMHSIANTAAQNFLNLLIRDSGERKNGSE